MANEYPTVLEPAPGAEKQKIMPGLPYLPSFIDNSLMRLAFYVRNVPVVGGLMKGFIESILSEMDKNAEASSIVEARLRNYRGAPTFGGIQYPKEWYDTEKEAKAKKEKPTNGQKKGSLPAYALLPEGYRLANSEF